MVEDAGLEPATESYLGSALTDYKNGRRGGNRTHVQSFDSALSRQCFLSDLSVYKTDSKTNISNSPSK